MTILRYFRKQPVENEIYGIQFARDMSATDQITNAWQLVARDTSPAWDLVVQEASYQATLDDNDRKIVSNGYPVTLPEGAPEGYRLNVANSSQIGSIEVGTFQIPARGAVVVALVDGGWIEEAKTTAILVDAVGDQRVRTRVSKGTPWKAYKIEVTVDTSESRTLQDEFVIEIEEE